MNLYEAIKNNLKYKYPSSHIYEYYSSEKEAKEVANELEREGKYVVDEIFPLGEEFGIWVHYKKDEDVCKRKWGIKESDSSFDVEGLADRIDILSSELDPYEYADVYGTYNTTEESYQNVLSDLYNKPESVLSSLESYEIIDWEDDIQTEYNEVIQDLKKWISISKSKNESEDSSKKDFWVKIKMKNNKQVLHQFNTEDEMYDYLNLLSHYVGQGEVEILDYTGKKFKKNESEYVVYTTSEIAPGEFKSDVYGKYTSSDQAEDVVAELRAKGIGARMVVESDGLTNRTQRLIPMGLNDKKSIDIINSVVGQLSDGIWENTPGMERYWKFIGGADNKGNIIVYDGYDSSKVYKGINRYGVPKHDTKWFYSAFQGKSDDEIKKYFAHKIKQIVKEEGLDWDRNNTDVCSYLDRGSGVTVRDAYKLYDKLLGRIDRITESIQMNKYLITLNFGGKKNNVKVVLTTSANEEGAKKQVCDYFNVPVSAVVKVEDKGSAIKESETSNITYLDSNTILDDLGSEYECIAAMYDVLGVDTNEEFFPEKIIDDVGNENLYLRSIGDKTEWVLSKNGKTVVCTGRDSANIPIVYFDNEVVKESDDEDDPYDNPVYDVEIRDLHLTNHGYHNNSDIAWGRIKLVPKDGSGIDDPLCGLWDVIYFRESDPLFCFKIGYPVKAVANALYDYNTDEGNYTVRINSEDIPVDDLWEKINRDCTKLSVDAEGAIEGAIERAIRDDSIDKVDYQ